MSTAAPPSKMTEMQETIAGALVFMALLAGVGGLVYWLGLEWAPTWINPELNDAVLMPDWYRAQVQTNGDGYSCPLHQKTLLIALWVYNTFWFAAIFVTKSNAERAADLLLVPILTFCTLYLPIVIISFLLSGLSYVVLGLCWEAGCFIPWDFLSFCLHVAAMVLSVLGFVALFIGKSRDYRPKKIREK